MALLYLLTGSAVDSWQIEINAHVNLMGNVVVNEGGTGIKWEMFKKAILEKNKSLISVICVRYCSRAKVDFLVFCVTLQK